VTEPPEEPGSRPGEDEKDSEAESSRAAGDAGEVDGGDYVEEEVPRPYTFRPMPNIDLSSILNVANFSELILPHLPDMSKIIQDFSHLVPPSTMLPLARFKELVLPALRVSEFAPKIDYAAFFPKLELPHLAPSPTWSLPSLPQFSPAFVAMLERLRESLPPNWPSDIDLEKVTTVAQDDGLPLEQGPKVRL
jgi:hypothetical protein